MKERINFIDRIEKGVIFAGPVEVDCDRKIQSYCLLPYYKHSKGCPNYNCKADCPPKAKYFPDVFNKDVFIVATWLDFRKYLEEKAKIHPDWNERELRNLRHWQGNLRAELRNLVAEKNVDNMVPIFSPEAMGVNLFTTCAKVGIFLEKYPQNRIHQVALLANFKSTINS